MRHLFSLNLLLFATSTAFLMLCWGTTSCQQATPTAPPVPLVEHAPVLDSVSLTSKLPLLLKHPELSTHIEISGKGIALFASVEDRMNHEPELIIYPEEYEVVAKLFRMLAPDSLRKYLHEKGTSQWGPEWAALSQRAASPFPEAMPGRPLQGWRIAVDPGHIAGDLSTAEVEGKFVKIRPSRATQYDRISFWEANLTLATAHLIRQQLDSMGATVMMTREQPGLSTEGESYWTWKKDHWPQAVIDSAESWDLTPAQLNYWLRKAQDKEIFRTFFNAEDLRNRAARMNAFRPHLSLIIHYNVHGPNWENRDAENFLPVADTNYLMAFVPGGFMKGELSRFEDRVALLRMLLTEDVPQSVAACEAFTNASVEHTGVPITPVDHELAYLHRSSVYAGTPGVYARNLSLTRMVGGALIYGESLNQDYRDEAIQLGKKDRNIAGIAVSRRVEDVAKAYVAAVVAFARAKAAR